ncbi:MAG: thioredoxin domain-containing protein [Bacteroides sp.]|nr:thioredoxin domain-containing protein [Bacteroides sp.]
MISNKLSNVFTSTLFFLNVKHTKRYSDLFYNEHPHKYNLFGLSKMLFDYGINNGGIKIENKNSDIFDIQTPFIAQLGDVFTCVHDVDSKKVSYVWNGKKMALSPEKFCDSWTGFILLVEKTDNAIEPNYTENRRKELFVQLQLIALLLIASCVFLMGIFFNKLYLQASLMPGILINLTGLYISGLLVQHQLKIHNKYADKICSVFHKSDCNNILYTKEAKFMGLISWSEVGFSYFLSNLIVFIFFPEALPVVALCNVMALPYTVWSIWYQKFKARQWCTLCICIQLIIWLFFITSVVFNYFFLFTISWMSVFTVIATYIVSFILLDTGVAIWEQKGKTGSALQELNSLKANEQIFSLLLQQQAYHKVDRHTSSVLFGNPDARLLVTILTNLYCSPCAGMHKRAENLLESSEDSICIQYIFSAFSEDLTSANKNLIAVYLQKDGKEAKEIYNKWFEGGKKMQDNFFADLEINANDPDVKAEFDKHEEWRNRTQISATPTILINGYQLPENYKIEDLAFITNI